MVEPIDLAPPWAYAIARRWREIALLTLLAVAVAGVVYRWREYTAPWEAQALVQIRPAEAAAVAAAAAFPGAALTSQLVAKGVVGLSDGFTLTLIADQPAKVAALRDQVLESMQIAVENHRDAQRQNLTAYLAGAVAGTSLPWGMAALDKLLALLEALQRPVFRVVAVPPPVRKGGGSLLYTLTAAAMGGLVVGVSWACFVEYARVTGLFRKNLDKAAQKPLASAEAEQWF